MSKLPVSHVVLIETPLYKRPGVGRIGPGSNCLTPYPKGGGHLDKETQFSQEHPPPSISLYYTTIQANPYPQYQKLLDPVSGSAITFIVGSF